MATVTTRAELSDYCLRALGSPVIEINVDDDQLDDRIDEALETYREYHSDAVVRTFRSHQVTDSDITNEYISLPEDFIFVKKIFPLSGIGSSSDIFSLDYQLHLNDLHGLRNPGDLISYEMSKQHLALIDMKVNGMAEQVTFNRHMDRLSIAWRWGTDVVADQYLLIEGYVSLDGSDYPDIYNDHWLKKYCTALFKKQWGNNLKKFGGLQMPGGVTLNGQEIYQEAVEELKELIEEVRSTWEEPIDWFVG